jgi:hypothetical protein
MVSKYINVSYIFFLIYFINRYDGSVFEGDWKNDLQQGFGSILW